MKTTLFAGIIWLTIGNSTGHFLLTAQYPDKIKFKGREYSLNSNPLELYFEQYPGKRPKNGVISTALWRGYVAHFEVIDNQLFVTDIQVEVRDPNSKDNHHFLWVSMYDEVFPNTKRTKLEEYSGILILPYGKMVNYVHMGYASTFTKYWLLEIERGNFNEARKYNHQEFEAFKQRQFEAFKQTEAYIKLFSELKKNDIGSDDTFIESFISDFVINYTSKFLVD